MSDVVDGFDLTLSELAVTIPVCEAFTLISGNPSGRIRHNKSKKISILFKYVFFKQILLSMTKQTCKIYRFAQFQT